MPNKFNGLCFFLWIFTMNLNGESASDTKPIASPTVTLKIYRNGAGIDDGFAEDISPPIIFLSSETGLPIVFNCFVIHTKDNPCSWAASYPHILPISTETKFIKKE